MNRVGLGHDAHRLVPGRRLVLGGVEVPFERGLDGHSDADVVSHAVADAVLAAAGLGELGELFPATEDRWKGASSLEFLVASARLLGERGARIVNVDCVLVADRPRLAPFRQAMCDNVARALGIRADQVSIKPKSNEGLGFEGRGEGMSAAAVALVEVPDRDGPGHGSSPPGGAR